MGDIYYKESEEKTSLQESIPDNNNNKTKILPISSKIQECIDNFFETFHNYLQYPNEKKFHEILNNIHKFKLLRKNNIRNKIANILSELEFQKDSSDFEYEIKIDPDNEDINLKELCSDLLGNIAFISPQVKKYQSAVTYFGNESREFYALLENESYKKVKIKSPPLKLNIKNIKNLEFIMKRHEIFTNPKTEIMLILRNLKNELFHEAKKQGTIIRKRKSTKIISLETGNGYSITSDNCTHGEHILKQLEIEYIGQYPTLGYKKTTKEQETIKELSYLGNQLLKEIPTGKFTTLTKYKWLLNTKNAT